MGELLIALVLTFTAYGLSCTTRDSHIFAFLVVLCDTSLLLGFHNFSMIRREVATRTGVYDPPLAVFQTTEIWNPWTSPARIHLQQSLASDIIPCFSHPSPPSDLEWSTTNLMANDSATWQNPRNVTKLY